MNLWQTFEIDKAKCSNNGISFRYEKGIDESLKQKYKMFAKWLRHTYVFPVPVSILTSDCNRLINEDFPTPLGPATVLLRSSAPPPSSAVCWV